MERGKSEKEYLDERVKTVPVGRFANPNEIGNLQSLTYLSLSKSWIQNSAVKVQRLIFYVCCNCFSPRHS